jgi:hypothetical protein
MDAAAMIRTAPPVALRDGAHQDMSDECGGQGLRDIAQIADSLVGAPFWTFWWD